MRLSRRAALELLLLVALAAFFSFYLRTQRPLGADQINSSVARDVLGDGGSPAEENAAADVTLVVFSDYRCPACRLAHPAMRRAVAKDGKVQIVYKDWPIFGEVSERAARVAIASDFQGIYPRVHDRLMTGPLSDEASLKAAVEAAGGDWERLQLDLLEKQANISARLVQNQRQAIELQLGGTPGYLVGPILIRGALTESEFLRAFQESRRATASGS